MAGIYIHIPFCKQACHYCDFHFSTSLSSKNDLLKALLREIDLRQDYLEGQNIHTIYLGGGTPSLLNQNELNMLFSQLNKYFPLDQVAEITLEANPDNLSATYLQELSQTPVNRLSIGIQSFFEEDLRWMNRAHHANEAHAAIEESYSAGFKNITIDLIYGVPGMSNKRWMENLKQAFEYKIPHLSCYALTVESGTALAHQIKSGKSAPVEDSLAASQFRLLMNAAATAGYIHYEISNFAKPGYMAVHNKGYWQGEHYIGIGPSAHSYNGYSRQWNVANNTKYIRSISKGEIQCESEVLSPVDQCNEYIMTSLRTMWGCDLKYIRSKWGNEVASEILDSMESYSSDLIRLSDQIITLTDKGKLMADRIASSAFLDG